MVQMDIVNLTCHRIFSFISTGSGVETDSSLHRHPQEVNVHYIHVRFELVT